MKRLLWILIVPISLLAAAYTGNLTQEANKEITWYSMEEAQRLAGESNKKVFIYALAQWCGYCKKMEKEVYPDQAVINTLEKYYYPVKLDIESDKTITFNNNTMTEHQFAREYRIRSTPTFFFLDHQGEILGAQPGYIPADTFNTLLTYVGTDKYKEIKFEEYLEHSQTETGDRE